MVPPFCFLVVRLVGEIKIQKKKVFGRRTSKNKKIKAFLVFGFRRPDWTDRIRGVLKNTPRRNTHGLTGIYKINKLHNSQSGRTEDAVLKRALFADRRSSDYVVLSPNSSAVSAVRGVHIY